MQDHLKSMTEVCDKRSAIGEPVNNEDHVVYILASLPESYNYSRGKCGSSITGRGNRTVTTSRSKDETEWVTRRSTHLSCEEMLLLQETWILQKGL